MNSFKKISIATFFTLFVASYSFASFNQYSLSFQDCVSISKQYYELKKEFEVKCRTILETGWGQPGMEGYCIQLFYAVKDVETYANQCYVYRHRFQ